MDEFEYQHETLNELQRNPGVQDAIRWLVQNVPLDLRSAHYSRGGEVFDLFKPYRRRVDAELAIDLTDPQWIAALAGMDAAMVPK